MPPILNAIKKNGKKVLKNIKLGKPTIIQAPSPPCPFCKGEGFHYIIKGRIFRRCNDCNGTGKNVHRKTT